MSTIYAQEEFTVSKVVVTMARVVLAVPHKGDAGIVIVLAPDKDLWNFPGGMTEEGETEEQAMRRELEEETGLIVREKSLFCGTQQHRYCVCHLFFAFIDDLSTLRERGVEGEKIKIVSEAEFHDLRDFLPLSRNLYRMVMKKIEEVGLP